MELMMWNDPASAALEQGEHAERQSTDRAGPTRRLGVLFVTGWYPTASDPAKGVFVREMAHAVARRHDVAVLHCVGPDSDCRDMWRVEREQDPILTEGLQTWRVRCRGSRVPGLTYPLYLHSIARAYRRVSDSGFVPDVIHAHSYEPGLPAVLLGRLHGTPTVISEHFSGFAQNRLSRVEIAKARYAFAHADRVMPVSAALQRVLERCGVRARFHIVPNTFDPALFSPAATARRHDGHSRLLFVGRLVEIKGIATLLRAAAIVAKSRGDWQLDIVGEGAKQLDYERLAAELGISGRVRFHGRRNKSQIAELMREADAFVLPSVWENMPCVLIEALASGLPVVATRTGGIPEIIDEESGILVPPGDELALSAAINRILDIHPTYTTSHLSGKAERFSLDSIGSECNAIYLQCLNL
jgi:glycosyltransferase involved in cell wall biosynthesis